MLSAKWRLFRLGLNVLTKDIITKNVPPLCVEVIISQEQSIWDLTHWGRVMHICIANLTTFLQIMACGLVGAKPSSEPMLQYC